MSNDVLAVEVRGILPATVAACVHRERGKGLRHSGGAQHGGGHRDVPQRHTKGAASDPISLAMCLMASGSNCSEW